MLHFKLDTTFHSHKFEQLIQEKIFRSS